MWALGNIAGDNYTYRDGITNSGVIDQLLAVMQEVGFFLSFFLPPCTLPIEPFDSTRT